MQLNSYVTTDYSNRKQAVIQAISDHFHIQHSGDVIHVSGAYRDYLCVDRDNFCSKTPLLYRKHISVDVACWLVNPKSISSSFPVTLYFMSSR